MKIYDDISELVNTSRTLNDILTRASERIYSGENVTDLQISALLHAAMAAPSGVNRQPWHFIVIDDSNLLKSLAEALPYAKMVANAPVAILCCGDKNLFLPDDDSELWVQDLAIASENILLAAHAIGLGAVYTCLYPHQDRMANVRSILSIPDRFVPFNLIPVGHPLHPRTPIDKWHSDRIQINSF